MPATSYTGWSAYDLGGVSAVGSAVREDLLDIITNIDPWDTPFYSSAPKTQSEGVRHEWIVDTLNATATGGAVEGADFLTNDPTTRSRLNNLSQIFRRDMSVSDTVRSINVAGVRDEYEYQVMKMLREVARNIESRVWNLSSTASATGSETAGRVMAAFKAFAVRTTAVTGALTSATAIRLHQDIYEQGGNPDTMYVAPGPKRQFTTDIAGNGNANVRNIAASDRRLIANIDVFESDFGLLAVVPDRFIPSSSVTADGNCAWLIERSKARLAVLRPLKHVPIPRGGDATRGIVLTELTLEVMHPSAHGAVVGVTA